MTDDKRLHPNHGELYTPIGKEFYDLLDQLHREYGNWRIVAWKTELRLKQLRSFRTGQRKAISLRVLDRMITASGVGNLHDFTFFTAEDLVKLGIWKEPSYLIGTQKVQGDVSTKAQELTPREREVARRKKRQDKRKAEKSKALKEANLWKKRRRRGMW